MSAPARLVPGRDCSDCTLCCTILGVPALNKPPGAACRHVQPNVGCQIYDRRPAECAAFHCGYLTQPNLAAHWRPKHAHMLLQIKESGRRIEAHVDPAQPEAWRAEPYYTDLKAWARLSAPLRRQVIVCVGLEDVIAILPDRDKRMGRIGFDERLVCVQHQAPGGVIYDVIAVHEDDPRAMWEGEE